MTNPNLNPDEQIRLTDDEILSDGQGSTRPGKEGDGHGPSDAPHKGGIEHGDADGRDGGDADGTDGGDADGTDGDSRDGDSTDGTDGDSGDADGTDGGDADGTDA